MLEMILEIHPVMLLSILLLQSSTSADWHTQYGTVVPCSGNPHRGWISPDGASLPDALIAIVSSVPLRLRQVAGLRFSPQTGERTLPREQVEQRL